MATHNDMYIHIYHVLTQYVTYSVLLIYPLIQIHTYEHTNTLYTYTQYSILTNVRKHTHTHTHTHLVVIHNCSQLRCHCLHHILYIKKTQFKHIDQKYVNSFTAMRYFSTLAPSLYVRFPTCISFLTSGFSMNAP